MSTIVNLKLKGLTLRGEQEIKKVSITIDADFKLIKTSLKKLQEIEGNVPFGEILVKSFPNGTKLTRKEQVDQYISDNSKTIIWDLMLKYDWQSCLYWKVLSLGERKKKATSTALATTRKQKKKENEKDKLSHLLRLAFDTDNINSEVYYDLLALYKEMGHTIDDLPYEKQFTILCGTIGGVAKAAALAYKHMGDLIGGVSDVYKGDTFKEMSEDKRTKDADKIKEYVERHAFPVKRNPDKE